MLRDLVRSLAPIGLGLCLSATAAVARAEEPPGQEVPPGLERLLEVMEGKPSKELLEHLGTVPEPELELLLDHYLAKGDGGWRRRVVSDALGWKILDRRTAGLRALAPSRDALADAPKFGVLEYPRTDGSTSTIPLESLIACRLLNSPYLWGGPKELRTTSPLFSRPRAGPAGLPSKGTLAARAARGGIVADPTAAGNQRLAGIVNGLLVQHSGTHGAWSATR